MEWEYKIEKFCNYKGDNSEKMLNKLGERGWELVSSVVNETNQIRQADETTSIAYIFKRSKSIQL